VYNVTRDEFESCRLNVAGDDETSPTPKIVALCDKPFKPNYFTLTFR
jgi:ephrin-B